MPLRYTHLIEALLVDLTAIAVVAFAVYYRRHRRTDLLFAYVALNVGLFAAGVMIVQQMRIGVAFGFGLFAILSIIRLRSDPIAPEEAAYYFISLVLGLLNGVEFRDRWLVVTLDVAIVAVIVLLDNRWVLPRSRRQMVTLDLVHPDEGSLLADLELRLGGRVSRAIVKQVDYVRDVTVVDVRYTPGPADRSSRPSRVRSDLAEAGTR
ncbi:MAG: DUF4956 domain-containing protein [Nocardioidaceae bacterium]